MMVGGEEAAPKIKCGLNGCKSVCIVFDFCNNYAIILVLVLILNRNYSIIIWDSVRENVL